MVILNSNLPVGYTSEVDTVLQVIILARESGMKLELSDIPVESLVPEPLQVRPSLSRSFSLNCTVKFHLW